MTTYQKSICCQHDVPDDILGEKTCITKHEDFSTVCLNAAVLRTTLSMLNNLRGNRIEYENTRCDMQRTVNLLGGYTIGWAKASDA